MDLTQLVDDAPELEERIGGVRVVFSEVSIKGLAELQAWIVAHVPHPLEAIRDKLAGLPVEIAADLAQAARREAKDWPPEIGTAEGAMALLGSTEGQAIAFHMGLLVHHPDATADDAARLYRALKREVGRSRDQARVRRIFATIFGTTPADDDDGEAPAPKNGRAPAAAGSTGASSSGAASRS